MLSTLQCPSHLHCFNELVGACGEANTETDISEILKRYFHPLLPFEMMCFGIGKANSGEVIGTVNDGFPGGFLGTVIRDQRMASPIYRSWRDSLRPQIQNAKDLPALKDEAWTESFLSHDLNSLCSHGILDVSASYASYFAFARTPLLGPEHKQLLQWCIPHLHVALSRAKRRRLFKDDKDSLQTLTPREQELLRYLCWGKHNEEIALIMSISVFTVKNHVHNILNKLSVSNRAHAVALALDHGFG